MIIGPAPVKHVVLDQTGKLSQEWASALTDLFDAATGEWRSGPTKIGQNRDVDAVLSVMGSAAFITASITGNAVKLPFKVYKTALTAYDSANAHITAYAENDQITIPSPGSGTHTVTGILLMQRS